MAGRLLLVGELNDDLTELKITLEAIGLMVEMAPDGLAGLEKGREFQPDLVVTEILTNRLSGFELASRISSGAAGFAAPVIFYTEFYRDEKSRREVLAKYGAVQYLVRPFQKEALKKSVAAHFQEFLSSLPAAPIVENTPEPAGSAPEVKPVVPQLRHAAVAAEKQPTSPVSGRPMQPGKPGGFSGEVPARFRAFSPPAQAPATEATEPEPKVAGTATDQPENQPVEVAATLPAPGAETLHAPAKDFRPHERGLLLPVEEPSWIGRLLQSIPLRIAAMVVVAALALYLARDRFWGGNENASTPSETPISAQPSPANQAAAEPPAQVVSSSTTAASTAPSVQEPPVEAKSEASQELAEPLPSSAPAESATKDSGKTTETKDSRASDRKLAPAVSIQDVTGSGKGPVLVKMKPIQLSQGLLSSLAARAVVVRVVIDSAGKVTKVTPLSRDSLPLDAIATIQQWEFSRSRRKGAGEAIKYFSVKVQKPRQ